MQGWAIHRVSLATHDLDQAHAFFGGHLGLGEPRRPDARTLTYGAGSRGLRVHKPAAALARGTDDLLGPAGARHLAIEVDDLNRVAAALDRASLPHVEAKVSEFDTHALYTIDPAFNVVAFCARPEGATSGEGVQPWEADWGWGIHHVNLEACDVRETVDFYVEIAGMAEGTWNAPADMGDFSIDPKELSILALDGFNRGVHIIRADAGFAHRNNFIHNPSIGGHPAFHVPDVLGVKASLEGDGIPVSDAHVYAMVGMHQIYAMDPSANMIEINQFV